MKTFALPRGLSITTGATHRCGRSTVARIVASPVDENGTTAVVATTAPLHATLAASSVMGFAPVDVRTRP